MSAVPEQGALLALPAGLGVIGLRVRRRAERQRVDSDGTHTVSVPSERPSSRWHSFAGRVL